MKSLPSIWRFVVKFIYSEKATKFLPVPVKKRWRLRKIFVAFSEYMNFNHQIYGEDFVNFRGFLQKYELYLSMRHLYVKNGTYIVNGKLSMPIMQIWVKFILGFFVTVFFLSKQNLDGWASCGEICGISNCSCHLFAAQDWQANRQARQLP